MSIPTVTRCPPNRRWTWLDAGAVGLWRVGLWRVGLWCAVGRERGSDGIGRISIAGILGRYLANLVLGRRRHIGRRRRPSGVGDPQQRRDRDQQETYGMHGELNSGDGES